MSDYEFEDDAEFIGWLRLQGGYPEGSEYFDPDWWQGEYRGHMTFAYSAYLFGKGKK